MTSVTQTLEEKAMSGDVVGNEGKVEDIQNSQISGMTNSHSEAVIGGTASVEAINSIEVSQNTYSDQTVSHQANDAQESYSQSTVTGEVASEEVSALQIVTLVWLAGTGNISKNAFYDVPLYYEKRQNDILFLRDRYVYNYSECRHSGKVEFYNLYTGEVVAADININIDDIRQTYVVGDDNSILMICTEDKNTYYIESVKGQLIE